MSAEPELGMVNSNQRADLLARIKVELQASLDQTTRNFVSSGTLLLQAKQLIGHGHFRTWLAENFQMSSKTANRLMAVAKLVRRFQLDDQAICRLMDLDLKLVYELAAKSTSLDLQREVLERLNQGEPIDYKLIRDFKRKALQSSSLPEVLELNVLNQQLDQFNQWLNSRQDVSASPSEAIDAHTRQGLKVCAQRLRQACASIDSILAQAELIEDQV